MLIEMGNPNALDVEHDPKTGKQERYVIGDGLKRTLLVDWQPHKSPLMVLRDITDAQQGIWIKHSADPAPPWVACENKAVEALLADHYGCTAGKPEGWKDGDPVDSATSSREAMTISAGDVGTLDAKE